MRTTPGRAPRRRGLPPGRRRVPRPAALPGRLGARLPRHRQRGAARQRDDRQRGRQRRRRRQARLHLRAGADPLLPRRGADPRQRRDLPARGRRTCCDEVLDRLDELVVKPVDGSGGKGIVIGPQRRPTRARRAAATAHRRPARLDRAAGRSQLSTVADADRRRHAAPPRRPAALRGQRRRTTSGCCPAASPGSRCRRASSSSTPARAAARRTPGCSAASRRTASRRRRARGPRPTRRRDGRRRSLAASRADARPAGPPRSTREQQQQQQQPRWRPRHAEPHRRVAVLDRPLRRAGRRHRAHPRRAPAAAARGPVDRRGRGLPVAAGASWASGRPTTATVDRGDVLDAARRRPRPRRLDRRRAGRGAGERPRRPRDRSRTEMWECLNATLARMPRARRRPTSVHEFFALGARAGRARRSGIAESTTSRDDGWQFFILGRSLERADMTARLLATRVARPRRPARRWTTILRVVRRLRGVPAHLPRACRARGTPPSSCCSTGCSRASVLLLVSARPRSACARSTPRDRGRRHRPGAAAARADPHRAGVPADRRAPRRAARRTCDACRRPARGHARRSASGTSRRSPSRAGWERAHERRLRIRHADRVPLRRRGRRPRTTRRG